MTRAVPYKTKQFFFVLIKLSIVFGAVYFIYNRLTNNNQLDFSYFIKFVSKSTVFSFKNIVFMLFLTCFNWFFEILKWKNLASLVKKTSFKDASDQSLGALTASLFTPNRIGEYGAKAIYFSKSLRKRILLLNLLGNMSQMIATLLFGSVGFTFFFLQYDIEIPPFKVSRFLIVIVTIIGFSIFGLRQNRYSIKGFSIDKIISFVKNIPLETHLKNMLFAILRYVIFSFQFFFLLKVFGIDISYWGAMVAITSMYLLASVIPTIFIFDVVIKGSVAVYLFSFLGISELLILSVVTIMWLFNFVLPSVIGSYYVLNFNWQTIKA